MAKLRRRRVAVALTRSAFEVRANSEWSKKHTTARSGSQMKRLTFLRTLNLPVWSFQFVQGVDRCEGNVDRATKNREGSEEGEGGQQGPLRQQDVSSRRLRRACASQPCMIRQDIS